MKKISILIFFATVNICFSQNLFEFEEEISNKNKYVFEDFSIENKYDKNIVKGTLIAPKNSYNKIIIIAPGTGYNSRNNHFILTEILLKNNIGVFRFDERESLNELDNLSSDLFFSTSHLIETTNKKIGFLGHSLGGLATMEVFEKLKEKIDFLILWASPIEKHGAFIKYQIEKGIKSYNDLIKAESVEKKIELLDIIHRVIANNTDKDINAIYKLIVKETKKKGFKKKQFKYYVSSPNTISILKKNFEETYKNIDIPLLYIIGANDQLINPKRSIKILNSYNNPRITATSIDGLNHFLNKKKLSDIKASDIYNIEKKASDFIINWLK